MNEQTNEQTNERTNKDSKFFTNIISWKKKLVSFKMILPWVLQMIPGFLCFCGYADQKREIV